MKRNSRGAGLARYEKGNAFRIGGLVLLAVLALVLPVAASLQDPPYIPQGYSVAVQGDPSGGSWQHFKWPPYFGNGSINNPGSADYPTLGVGGYDQLVIIPVQDGVDEGEPDVLQGMVHHCPENLWDDQAWQYKHHRVESADHATRNDNYLVMTVGDITPHLKCNKHKMEGEIPAFAETTAQLLDPVTLEPISAPSGYGNISIENQLTGTNAQPGYYEIEISHNGTTVYREKRGFGVGISPYLALQCLDQTGAPIYGVSWKATALTGTDGIRRLLPDTLSNQWGPSTPDGWIMNHVEAGVYEGSLITADQSISTTPLEALPRTAENPFGYDPVSGSPANGMVSVAQRANVVRLHFPRGVKTVDKTRGELRFTVLDGDNGDRPILNMRVGFVDALGQDLAQLTGITGECLLQSVGVGHYTAQISGSPFQTGWCEVDVVGATQRRYVVHMFRAKGPVVDTVGNDGGASNKGPSLDFLTKLFTPSKATLDKWSGLSAQMQSWGPFGFVGSFLGAWTGTNTRYPRLAGSELVWGGSFSVFGPYGAPIPWSIDLRPHKDGGGLYSDGKAGTALGDFYHVFRVVLGWMVWGFFGLAVYRWTRPQFTDGNPSGAVG